MQRKQAGGNLAAGLPRFMPHIILYPLVAFIGIGLGIFIAVYRQPGPAQDSPPPADDLMAPPAPRRTTRVRHSRRVRP